MKDTGTKQHHATKSVDFSQQISKYLTVGTTLLILFVIFFLFYQIISPFLSIIFVAFIIAVVLSPLHSFIISHITHRVSLSAIIALLIFMICAIIPLSVAILLLFHEISNVVAFLRANVGDISTWEGQIENTIRPLLNQYGLRYDDFSIDVQGYLLTLAQYISQRLGIFITRTGSLVTNSIITLIVTYYLLVDKKRIISFISSINPLKSKNFLEIQKKSVDTINATIKGNVIIILLQGLVGFLGFVLFGVASPFLLGFIYGIFAIIPNIGAALIWIPSTLYIFATQGILSALGFLAYCYVTNFIVDQFITPRILGGSAQLHPLLILFAVLGGIQAFGLLGIILGPFIITLFFIAVDIYKDLLKHK
jgi:predicted PurR-regulated permease PerM